jgi:uncharacterized membrane protein
MVIDTLKRAYAHIISAFWSGLFTVIPVAATLFFIHFLYGFLTRHLAPLRNLEPHFLQIIPGSEFVLIMLIIVLIGVWVKIFITHKMMHIAEGLIARIPLVRIVYSSSKVLVNFFKLSGSTAATKKSVVLIPYPRQGQYHLAFLLESAEASYQDLIPAHIKPNPNEKYYKVFMPNSPNPSSGYFFIMPESEIIHTDISFEEAIKALVSCGIMTPDSLLKK